MSIKITDSIIHFIKKIFNFLICLRIGIFYPNYFLAEEEAKAKGIFRIDKQFVATDDIGAP